MTAWLKSWFSRDPPEDTETNTNEEDARAIKIGIGVGVAAVAAAGALLWLNSGSSEDTEETYYHYTDEAGSRAIKSSGMIRASSNARGDCTFGEGVYLTQIPPTNKALIAMNNYDGMSLWFRNQQMGKVDYYIAVKLPKQIVTRATNSRDVHVYIGDMILANFKYDIQKV